MVAIQIAPIVSSNYFTLSHHSLLTANSDSECERIGAKMGPVRKEEEAVVVVSAYSEER